MLEFHHRIPRTDIALGIVVVSGVDARPAGPTLVSALDECIEHRKHPLPPRLETRRLACREMLRNGTYKPTGRAKPASEYLLKAASEGPFPRINALVDANNWLSLQELVPIPLWDLDLVQSNAFEFRLGTAEERYVFNAAGQVLELRDLVCGAARSGDNSTPIVNPVKDSLATKTTAETRRIAACIYFPLQGTDSLETLSQITEQLLVTLLASKDGARGGHGQALPDRVYRCELG